MSDTPTHAPYLTSAQLRELLRAAIASAGSQKAVAAECCVTPRLVCMCLSGDRAIGGRIAQRLGYRRTVVYVPIEA